VAAGSHPAGSPAGRRAPRSQRGADRHSCLGPHSHSGPTRSHPQPAVDHNRDTRSPFRLHITQINNHTD
jgi:hypothetical protein